MTHPPWSRPYRIKGIGRKRTRRESRTRACRETESLLKSQSRRMCRTRRSSVKKERARDDSRVVIGDFDDRRRKKQRERERERERKRGERQGEWLEGAKKTRSGRSRGPPSPEETRSTFLSLSLSLSLSLGGRKGERGGRRAGKCRAVQGDDQGWWRREEGEKEEEEKRGSSSPGETPRRFIVGNLPRFFSFPSFPRSLSAVRISRTPSISGIRSGRYFPGIDYEP